MQQPLQGDDLAAAKQAREDCYAEQKKENREKNWSAVKGWSCFFLEVHKWQSNLQSLINLLDLMSSQHEARKEAYSANKEKLAEMESKLLEKREDSAQNP